MSDVTAVILSIGEETTERAVASVQRQTLAAEEIIVIRNVSPWHRALNLGASKVKTDFLVQVDSDMILDENCVEDLRACMSWDVGMVLGSLRDPLMGRIGWIKLFRTECFEKVQYRDLVSSDVVFTEEISNYGWMMVYAIRAFEGVSNETWHTFGEHRPDYTPHYTYSKYLMEGRKYRYRKVPGALAWHLKKLANSGHPAALIAQIALGHGIFIRETGDLLKPYVADRKFDDLLQFLDTIGSAEFSPLSSSGGMDEAISVCRDLLPWSCFSAEKIFKKTYQAGIKLRQANALPAFQRCLAFLNDSRDPFAWIGKVGLCHGLFFDASKNESVAEDYKLLEELVNEDVLRSPIKAKLKYFLLALKRRIVSTYSWDLARRAIKRSYNSAKPSFSPTPRFSLNKQIPVRTSPETLSPPRIDVEYEFRRRCAAVGAHIKVERLPYILGTGRIIVGDHAELSGSSDITFSNIVRRDPELRIGNYTFIGHRCSLNVADSVVIGEQCIVAAGVRIQDFDGHPMDAELRRAGKPTPPEGIKPIRIGNLAWIGNNCYILKGVTIGERAVVAAMSLVADDVPADALVGGNPARVIKYLNGRGPAQLADAIPLETFSTSEHHEWEFVRTDQDRSETRIKNVIAAVARVPVENIDSSDWVDGYGIDSLKLLIARETLERELRLRFSDRVWFNFRSIRDIVDFVDRAGFGRSREIYPAPVSMNGTQEQNICKPPSFGRRYTRSGTLYTDIEIGMPLTGCNNLAEGPLLQQLGDLRWAHISQLTGVPSCSIADAEGQRLYATFFFVEVLFPENRPMASYRPDDQIKVAGDLKRFGTSILDGTFYLLPPDAPEFDPTTCGSIKQSADAPQVRLANVFVRQQRGAEHLLRSRPAAPGFERIAELTEPPDSYLQVKAAERDGSFARPPGDYVRMTSAPVTVKYNLDPDRDVNGVGLIYFAHYPVFLDIAERQVLRTAGISEALIDRRTLIHRRSAYMSNASANDSLLIEVEPWTDNLAAPHRLWLNFRMHRASDGRLMMISTAEKVFFNGSE